MSEEKTLEEIVQVTGGDNVPPGTPIYCVTCLDCNLAKGTYDQSFAEAKLAEHLAAYPNHRAHISVVKSPKNPWKK